MPTIELWSQLLLYLLLYINIYGQSNQGNSFIEDIKNPTFKESSFIKEMTFLLTVA